MEYTNVLGLQELQIIVQLVDNIDNSVNKLEKDYTDKNAFGFEQSKQDILKSQKKIQDILK